MKKKAKTTIRPAEPEEERTVPSPSQRSLFGYASLFLIIAILAGFWIFSENLITSLDRQAAEITSLRETGRQHDELFRILRTPGVEIVEMKGMKADSIIGKIFWNPPIMAVILQVSNLRASTPDSGYQLWIMKKKESRSAGLFSIRKEEEGKDIFKVMRLDVPGRNSVDAFALTIGPKGGATQPSGPMLLLGRIRN